MFALLAGEASAAAPQRSWRTITTPRFRVHYHTEVADLAQRTARDAEAVLDPLCRVLGNVPELPIHLVITDETDAANGFASVLPHNVVVLLTGVPDPFGGLGDYDDFWRLLLIHELAHIVHIDNTTGLLGAINLILGKTLSPNQVQPRWMLEGVAVWLESKLTSAGRVRSALVDMLVRTQILAGRFPAIDEVSTLLRRFPGGSVQHLFGGRFLDFVARRHGDDAIGWMADETGSRIVPYGLNIVARRVTGEDFVQMWDLWVAEETAKAEALLAPVRQEGLRLGAALADEAETMIFARHGPEGLLAYVAQPDDGDSELVVRRGGETLGRWRANGGAGAFTPDGRAFIAAVSDVADRRFNVGDLERIDLETKRRRRLTVGARVQHPDVSPDGRTIVAVAQAGGETRLVTLPISGGRESDRRASSDHAHDEASSSTPTGGEATTGEAATGKLTLGVATTGEAATGKLTLGVATTGEAPAGEATAGVPPAGGPPAGAAQAAERTAGAATGGMRTIFAPGRPRQVHDPSWSPDGRFVAASLSDGLGTRQLAIIEVATGDVRTVTSGARDLGPRWTADGAALIFHSDRGGIFNIHRVQLEDGRIEQLSNVETGAFAPSLGADGVVVFSHATADGYELRVLTPTVATAPRPAGMRPTTTATATAVTYPDAEYSPWEALIPKAWLPSTGLDGLGGTYGITIAGGDTVGHHQYLLRVDYGVGSRQLGYGFSYTNRQLTTPFRISSSLGKRRIPGAFSVPIGRALREETVWRLNAGLDIPLSRWDGTHNLSLGYAVELRRGITATPDDPFQYAPLHRGDLTLSSASVGWHFTNVRAFTDSISAAEGLAMNLSLRVNHPAIGSDLSILEIGGRLSGYISMPWLSHHVLAMRLSAGTSAGDAAGRAVYSLGGLPVRDILSDVVDNIRLGGDVIRGYELGARRGFSFYLASLEYRLPIWTVERGIDTLPMFFDRVHGAVFVDAGDAPVGVPDLTRIAVGLGAEINVDLVFGYLLAVRLRLGYGRGLAEDGIHNVYVILGHGF